jgi:hypothetical protein
MHTCVAVDCGGSREALRRPPPTPRPLTQDAIAVRNRALSLAATYSVAVAVKWVPDAAALPACDIKVLP